MTDKELLAFLEWLRMQYLLAQIDVQQIRPTTLSELHSVRGLKIEPIANEEIVRRYRKSEVRA